MKRRALEQINLPFNVLQTRVAKRRVHNERFFLFSSLFQFAPISFIEWIAFYAIFIMRLHKHHQSQFAYISIVILCSLYTCICISYLDILILYTYALNSWNMYNVVVYHWLYENVSRMVSNSVCCGHSTWLQAKTYSKLMLSFDFFLHIVMANNDIFIQRARAAVLNVCTAFIQYVMYELHSRL